MNKMIAIIWGAVTVAFFCIVPVAAIRNTVISENQIAYEKAILSIAYNYQVSQPFIPQYDYIEQIEICVNTSECDKSQGYLMVCILDSSSVKLYESTVSLADMPNYGWISVISNIQLKAGEQYYLTLDAVDTIDNGPAISFYPESVAASEEEKDQILSYVDVPIGQAVLKARFQYGVELSKTDYIAYYLFLSFAVFMIFSRFSLRKEYKHDFSNRLF